MTPGTAMRFVNVLHDGRLAGVSQLDSIQWALVVVTGVFLLLFTTITFTAIRHASVSAVLAIRTAAPIVTVLSAS